MLEPTRLEYTMISVPAFLSMMKPKERKKNTKKREKKKPKRKKTTPRFRRPIGPHDTSKKHKNSFSQA
jgi:hypothetical protein